jgi:hypothetical protein
MSDAQTNLLVEKNRRSHDARSSFWACGKLWRIIAIIISPLAIGLFILLENLNTPMTIWNWLTPVMIVILGLELILFALFRRSRSQNGCQSHELANRPRIPEQQAELS